jgi:hypothetical protein
MDSVTDQAAIGHIRAERIDGRQTMPGGKRYDQFAIIPRHPAAGNNQAAVGLMREGRNSSLDFIVMAWVDRTQFDPD